MDLPDLGPRSPPQSPDSAGSSSFTISTPSESIEDTSSIAELESTQASSAAGITPSTTGDSFSAVKLAGVTPSTTDDSLSIDRLAQVNMDESLSLDKLVEENAEPEDLVELGIQRESSRQTPKTKPLDKNILNMDSGSSSTLDSLNSWNNMKNGRLEPKEEALSQSVPKSFTPSKWSVTSKDSVKAPVVLSSKDQSSSAENSSLYYSPTGNVSGVEPMDTEPDTSEPKSWHGSETSKPISTWRITKSNDTLDTLDTLDSISEVSDKKSVLSDQSDPSILSPTRKSLMELNRQKFFFEAAQPLRIDPKSMFEDLRPKSAKTGKNKENEVTRKADTLPASGKNLDLKREWQSLEHRTPTSPTAGMTSQSISYPPNHRYDFTIYLLPAPSQV